MDPTCPEQGSVTRLDVQFLERHPQRPHIVIGIITPPSGEYETEAEAIKAMRKIAAKHGANAIYIESATKEGGWRFGFSRFGGEGGSFSDVQYRAGQSSGDNLLRFFKCPKSRKFPHR